MKVNVVVIDNDGTQWAAGRCRIEECDEVMEECCRWGLGVNEVDGNTYGRGDLSGILCVLDGALSFVIDVRAES